MVSKTLSTSHESISDRFTRSFNSICTEAQARIEYVNQGVTHAKEINNKCMNYEEFDAYSTPARDQTLKELFEKYKTAYTDAENEGLLNSLSPKMAEYAEIIFKNKYVTHNELLLACPINYRLGASINLAELWNRINSGVLSSHPNDKIEIRWGETTQGKTKCKRWY